MDESGEDTELQTSNKGNKHTSSTPSNDMNAIASNTAASDKSFEDSLGNSVLPTKLNKVAATNKEGKPEKDKTRKDKPSSRVRFTESAQPNFVSIGLDKVSLLFGNEVILKDATFAVNTGERVGLVGPNGGGKVSILLNDVFD